MHDRDITGGEVSASWPPWRDGGFDFHEQGGIRVLGSRRRSSGSAKHDAPAPTRGYQLTVDGVLLRDAWNLGVNKAVGCVGCGLNVSKVMPLHTYSPSPCLYLWGLIDLLFPISPSKTRLMLWSAVLAPRSAELAL